MSTPAAATILTRFTKTIAHRPRLVVFASVGIATTIVALGVGMRHSPSIEPSGFDIETRAERPLALNEERPRIVGQSIAAQPAKPPPIRSRPWPSIRMTRPTRCSTGANGMQASNALLSQSASYLGSGTADTVNGVEIAADCAVLAVGKMQTLAGVDPPQPLVPGVTSSTGLLVELATEGRTIRRQRSFGTVINDIAINAVDELLIGGDAGLVRLGADLNTLRWNKTTLGAATRVALADDGTAAALFGKTLRIFDAAGNELANRSFGDSQVNDVAIDANGVYVTGFAQRDGGPCSQLQVAWVRSYTRAGVERWKAWDWTHAQAAATSSSCADTRGLRIATGRDGALYFAGESAGGNTIFRYQSIDLAISAGNVKTDAFNDAYNTASNHITYLAQLDPANGRVLKGSLLLARLADNKGNTIRPRAITADEQGRVYVAGASSCCIQNRSALTFNGTTMAAYAGGDPWVLVLSPDLRTRLMWFSSANGGKGEANGVAVSRGLAVLGARSDAAPMLLDRPVQPTYPSAATSGGHTMTWSVANP
jgi:hypothetical protein